MIFRKKKVFVYNEESCSYEEIQPSLAKKTLPFLFLSLTLGVSFWMAWYFFQVQFHQMRQASLSTEKDGIYSRLADLESELNHLQTNLEGIYRHNQNLYNPILQQAMISDAEWMGGRGGSEKYWGKDDQISRLLLKIDILTHQATLLDAKLDKAQVLAVKNAKKIENTPSLIPVAGAQLMSGFGTRNHPIRGEQHFHTGLDFGCSIGTPVFATADGVVSLVEDSGNGYGLNIEVDHQNGYVTKYAHLSSSKVSVGQSVKRGDCVALSGNSGLSSGPHLHYEIIQDGVKIDPIDYFYLDLSPGAYKKAKAEMQSMD